jgi:hypothetical protein
MKRLWLSLLLLAASVSMSLAQSPVTTYPYGVTSHNDSTTVASTNTFQSIWIASGSNTGRSGCAIQNNGSATMYVYFGPIANATTPNSIKLSTGQSLNCETVGGVVIKDQVSITGTSGDRFYASQY